MYWTAGPGWQQHSVRLHAQLNLIKAIARQCSAIGQLQLSSSTLNSANNNKLRCHSRKMFSVDSQFTSGRYHFSNTPLFRTPPAAEQPEESALAREVGTMDSHWQLSAVTSLSPPCSFQCGLQRVRAKVNFPQFLFLHGRDKPHYKSLLVVELPESRRTRRSL